MCSVDNNWIIKCYYAQSNPSRQPLNVLLCHHSTNHAKIHSWMANGRNKIELLGNTTLRLPRGFRNLWLNPLWSLLLDKCQRIRGHNRFIYYWLTGTIHIKNTYFLEPPFSSIAFSFSSILPEEILKHRNIFCNNSISKKVSTRIEF